MKKALRFCGLVCAISWAVAGIAFLLGMRKAEGLSYTIFASCFMWLPAVAAIILQLINKEKPFRNVNVSFKFNRWFIVAGLVPAAAAFIILGVNLLFPGVSFSATYEGLISRYPEEQRQLALEQMTAIPFALYMLLMVFQGLIAAYTINALFAFGEEFGWRGYLLRELQGRKFLLVSLITGAVWGIWHFPLILMGHNYPEHPVAGVPMMIIFCVLLSPVMTYITVKSKSVISTAIFHGSVNAIGPLSILYVVGGNDLTNSVTGLAGFISLLIINLLFFLFDKFVTKENLFTKEVSFPG